MCRCGSTSSGPAHAAAIAAGQQRRLAARAREQFGDRDRGRRLAGAAEREIADADDRHAGALRLRRACATPRRAVERAERRQQRRQQCPARRHQKRGSRMVGAAGRAATASDRARAPAAVRSSAPPRPSTILCARSRAAWARAVASCSQAPSALRQHVPHRRPAPAPWPASSAA